MSTEPSRTFVLQVPHIPWLHDDGIETPFFLAATSTVSDAFIVKDLVERESLTVKVSCAASLRASAGSGTTPAEMSKLSW
jgi:hypothetical protein